MSRCTCGREGSWAHHVRGSAGGESAVWRGCPVCPGATVGRPVPATVFARGLTAVAQYEEARYQRERREAEAEAVAKVDGLLASLNPVGRGAGGEAVYHVGGRYVSRRMLLDEAAG